MKIQSRHRSNCGTQNRVRSRTRERADTRAFTSAATIDFGNDCNALLCPRGRMLAPIKDLVHEHGCEFISGQFEPEETEEREFLKQREFFYLSFSLSLFPRFAPVSP
jgi:hypothetical protein